MAETSQPALDRLDMVARAIAVQIGGEGISDLEWLRAQIEAPDSVEFFRKVARSAIAAADIVQGYAH